MLIAVIRQLLGSFASLTISFCLDVRNLEKGSSKVTVLLAYLVVVFGLTPIRSVRHSWYLSFLNSCEIKSCMYAVVLRVPTKCAIENLLPFFPSVRSFDLYFTLNVKVCSPFRSLFNWGSYASLIGNNQLLSKF